MSSIDIFIALHLHSFRFSYFLISLCLSSPLSSHTDFWVRFWLQDSASFREAMGKSRSRSSSGSPACSRRGRGSKDGGSSHSEEGPPGVRDVAACDYKGIIKKFVKEKGFGFIKHAEPGLPDVFFHVHRFSSVDVLYDFGRC